MQATKRHWLILQFKKRGDKAAAKSAARKQLKKTGKNGADRAGKARPAYAADYGLMTAFHHMQRASVVMSLMEEGTGEDLRRSAEAGGEALSQGGGG